jgi:hypothetical protein
MTNPRLEKAVAKAVGWTWFGDGRGDCGRCTCDVFFCYAGQEVDGVTVYRYTSTEEVDAIAALQATGCDWTVDREDKIITVTLWQRGRVRDEAAKLASKWDYGIPMLPAGRSHRGRG